jgi:dihydrodipicolinate synthase/N-acetylneuraminate lyase
MPDQSGFNRRSLLSMVAAAVGGNLAPLRAEKSSITPVEFKQRLTGPILSIPTVYTRERKIDRDGIRNMVELASKAGVKVFSLTAGNSQYDRLTYEEIKELTRIAVESVAGKGILIAATGAWWTGQAVDYGRFAESIGADALQVTVPAGSSDDQLLAHLQAIASSTRLGLVLHGQPSLRMLERLLAIESLVAMKEEFTVEYTVPVYQRFGERLNIFAGGGKARFLMYQPYGMRAFYSTFATFAPQIGMRFWNAVQRGDVKTAREIIFRYDVPFFERWTHSFWRATLEHFGVAKRFMRSPDETFTDGQMAEVKAFYSGLGLG